MHIVHFAKFYPPEWGGMESVTRDLALAAVRRGHRVTVVAFSRRASGSELVEGVEVIRCPVLATVASQPLSPAYLRAARRHGRTADAVHIHFPNPLALIPLRALPPRVRIVLHWQSDIIGKGLLGRLVAPVEHALASRADAIIASTPPYAESSPVLRRHADKVVIVPNGIADPAREPRDAALPADIARFVGARRLLLAIGRLVSYKGFTHLIRAAPMLGVDAAIVIVGEGPLEAELRAQVARDGVTDRVMIAGARPRATLLALLAAADLYVMSSDERSEAFGVVLLEAMAFGVPIIATEIPGSGVSWVNADDVSGRNVPCADPTALARAMQAMLGDDAARARYSAGARARFDALFTDEIMADAVVRLYAGTITNRGGG